MYRARAEQLKYHDFPICTAGMGMGTDTLFVRRVGTDTLPVRYNTTIHTYICTDIIRLASLRRLLSHNLQWITAHQFGLHVWHQSTDLHHFRRPRLSALWWSWFESWLFNKMIPRIKCLRLLRRQRLHFFCWKFWETLNHQSTTRL